MRGGGKLKVSVTRGAEATENLERLEVVSLEWIVKEIPISEWRV